MTTIQKIIGILMGLAIIIIGVATFSGHKATLGDATVSNYPTWYYNGIVIGAQNKLTTNMAFGTCVLTGAASMANLASATLTCAAVGAKVGDIVNISSATPVVSGGNGGFPIIGGTVTTPDQISVTMVNNTGGIATPSGIALNAQYEILR